MGVGAATQIAWCLNCCLRGRFRASTTGEGQSGAINARHKQVQHLRDAEVFSAVPGRDRGSTVALGGASSLARIPPSYYHRE